MAAQKISIFLPLTAVLFAALATQTNADGNMPNFDCSSVIVKESEGVLNWLGNITFIAPVSTTPEGWTMTLTFDQKFTGVGVWDVTTINHGEEMYALFMSKPENAQLTAGDKLSFRFRVNYGRDIPQPKAVGLKFFETELCQ